MHFFVESDQPCKFFFEEIPGRATAELPSWVFIHPSLYSFDLSPWHIKFCSLWEKSPYQFVVVLVAPSFKRRSWMRKVDRCYLAHLVYLAELSAIIAGDALEQDGSRRPQFTLCALFYAP